MQRLGRVLRVADGKRPSVVYQFYIGGTRDEQWCKDRTSPFKGVAKEIQWVNKYGLVY